jgi:hypothetical protein
MEMATKNDVLASSLLFATLPLALIGRVARWTMVGYDAQTEATYIPAFFPWRDMIAWTVLLLLLRASLYYGVRRGLLGAKLLLLVLCLYSAYSSTNLAQAFVVGVDLAYPSFWSLPVLLENLLTLAALVLMLKKPTS